MFNRRTRGTARQELTRTVAVWLTQVGLVGGVWGFASLLTPVGSEQAVRGGFAPLVATFSPGFSAGLTLLGPLLFLAGYFLKGKMK